MHLHAGYIVHWRLIFSFGKFMASSLGLSHLPIAFCLNHFHFLHVTSGFALHLKVKGERVNGNN
jgi:hypothetical protein